MGSGRRKGSDDDRGVVGELAIVNNEKGVFGLADLMKASAEVLGNGGSRRSDRGLSGSVLLKTVEGAAKGLGYLCTEFASSNLPHGNLKSSTVPTFIANYM
ncbi:hypothetical protein DKX38_004074 [Salix brachista]|uniref:Uncharacterized protein n=1 Tax=Salix brachista TaxID=2182728 RepID=A0A5N5N940_9ROSI|nr:hypothetical protein DKX38_004074 [Salix brachista]